MSRIFICGLATWACLATCLDAHGPCGRLMQRSMMTTCQNQAPNQPNCPSMQQRLITTSQMTQRQFQTTTLLQRVRQPMTPFQPMTPQRQRTPFQPITPQRQMTPVPLVPALVMRTPMQPIAFPLMFPQPVVQMPQVYTGLRSPIKPPANMATPVANKPALQTPIKEARWEEPVKPVVRTPEEQEAFTEAALKRGLIAEGEGNYHHARACYKTALIYPETPAARSARKTLKRVETMLEDYPSLAEISVPTRESDEQRTVTARAEPRSATPTAVKTIGATPPPTVAVPVSSNVSDATRRDLHRVFNPSSSSSKSRLTLPTGIVQ